MLTEIRTHELRFNEDETRMLLERLLQASFGREDVRVIDHQFEGWVTGLRLAALTMRDPSRVEQVMERMRGSNRYVRDFLISEVTAQLPTPVRDFLVKTAILDRLTGPLCDAVVGLDEAECHGQAYLEWLLQINLFTVPLDENGRWFRYHNLMRDYLQQELVRNHGTDEISELHTRASAWLAQNGWVDEAIQHALMAGDSRLAAHLATQHRHDLIDQEQWHRLERRLRLFDQAAIEGSPGLGIIEAWLHNVHGRRQEELATLARVESLLASQAIAPDIAQSIQGEIHLMRANILGWSYDGIEVLKHAEIALELLPRQWRYAYTSALMIDSYGHLLSGNTDLAREQLYRGLADPQFGNQPQYKTMLLFGLTGLGWASLNLSEMRQFSELYLVHGEEFNLPEAIAVANYFLGCVHYLQNDLKAAHRHFSKAVETRYIVSLNWHIQAACGLVLTYYALDKGEQAMDILHNLQAKLIERNNFALLNVIKACQAELALREGKVAEANHWAESYDPEPIIGLQMFYIPQLTLIKAWLVQDTPASNQNAVTLLGQLMEIAKGAHLASVLPSILPMRSLLAEQLGDEAAALNYLADAIHLAEPHGIIRPFVDFGPQMAKLLVHLRRQGVAQDFITRVIEAFPTKPQGVSTTHHGYLIEPLTDRELEVLTLLAQQKRNQDIADELVITLGTVKQYTHKIYQKLDVNNRQAAVTKATGLGILTPES